MTKTVLGIALPHEHPFVSERGVTHFHDSHEAGRDGLRVRLQIGPDGNGAIYVEHNELHERTQYVVHSNANVMVELDDMQRRMLLRLATQSPFLLALVDEEAKRQEAERERAA